MAFCSLKWLLFCFDRKPKNLAKRITKEPDGFLRNAEYNISLVTGSTRRAESTRIVSNKHVLQTVLTKKLFLSTYENTCRFERRNDNTAIWPLRERHW